VSGVTDTGANQFVRHVLPAPTRARFWRLAGSGFLATSTFAFELTDPVACTPTRTCTTNAQCLAPEVCNAGLCGACTRTSQCGSAGACLGPGCGPCTSAAQCDADAGQTTCDAGRCH
jgi:hypothetical protein